MQYDDLKFTVKDITGENISCDIYSLLPKNESDCYVVYSDNELDENNNIIFKYGLLQKTGNDYYLNGDVTDEELNHIKAEFGEDIKKFVDEMKENV